MLLLDVILPLLLIMALGYSSVSLKLIDKTHIQAISLYVLKVALPCFLLYALSTKNLAELWQPSYLIAYTTGSLITLALTYMMCRRFFQDSQSHAAILSLGTSMSNTGFIGTAVLSLLIGTHAAIYISLTLVIENLVIIFLALILAEMGQQQGQLKHVVIQTLKNLIKNPLIIAMLLGLSFILLDLKFITPIESTLSMLGKTASPVAMFVIGGSLVGIGFSAMNLQSALLVALKCILMPAVVFALLWFLPDVSNEMLFAGTLIAGLPMAIVFGLFGQRYGLSEKALTPLLISTIVGFIGISIWVLYADQFI